MKHSVCPGSAFDAKPANEIKKYLNDNGALFKLIYILSAREQNAGGAPVVHQRSYQQCFCLLFFSDGPQGTCRYFTIDGISQIVKTPYMSKGCQATGELPAACCQGPDSYEKQQNHQKYIRSKLKNIAKVNHSSIKQR